MAFPNPIYVLLKGQQYLTIANALSETEVDVTGYDQTMYRNELSASYIGREFTSPIAVPFVSPGTPESKDDRITATVPFDTAKKRTIMKWWSGAAGTGDVVGKCWADQFIGYATEPPQFIS